MVLCENELNCCGFIIIIIIIIIVIIIIKDLYSQETEM